MKLTIEGGRVYDPANGIDGGLHDVHVDGGRIVEPSAGFAPDRRLDARGCAVLPGGVDLHCHIAGPSINRARRLLAGSARSSARGPASFEIGRRPLVPCANETGDLYSLLGYTTAIDAAIAPAATRQVHFELADTPNLDAGFLLLLANNRLLLELLDRGESELAREVVGHYLAATGAFGIKAVNAGGGAHWAKTGEAASDLRRGVAGLSVTPERILGFLATTAVELGLPHPLHIHAAGLGRAGNIAITLETSRALAGIRHHLTHVQFNAYARDDGGGIASGAAAFIEHLEAHPELTADVGQVMFGDALTISADREVEHFLWKVTGRPWIDIDIEHEAGCGIVPIEYMPRSRLHALQWILGLELLLLNDDPWRLALSTDHPNGAAFLSYPLLIAQLMDAGLRKATLDLVDPNLAERSALRHLSREYTLSEIATISRAGPARILGLESKGHLGPGADADVTVYSEQDDKEAMFRRPRFVLRGGALIVEDSEIRARSSSATLVASHRDHDDGADRLESWHEDHASFDASRLGPVAELRRAFREIGGTRR